MHSLKAAEILAKKSKLKQAELEYNLQLQIYNELTVRAESAGVLQEVIVEVGQQLNEGELVAKLSREDDLRVDLLVQESFINSVKVGQKVEVVAGENKTVGEVLRIDPVVNNGAILVEVDISAQMLPGARPDLRVEGKILIDRLERVLKLKRPLYATANSETLVETHRS